MHGPREVLNEIKWRRGALDGVEVHYVHRGAPGEEAILSGTDVVALGTSFLEVRGDPENTMIPYHRVFRIDREGRTVWVRRGREEH